MSRIILARRLRNIGRRGGIFKWRGQLHFTGSDVISDMLTDPYKQGSDDDEDPDILAVDSRAKDSPLNECRRRSAPTVKSEGKINGVPGSPGSPGTISPESAKNREEISSVRDDDPISVPGTVNGRQNECKSDDVQFNWLLNWSVNPEGKVLFYWKAFVTIAIIYNCGVVILRTAFKEMRDERLFLWLDATTDVIYLLDIFIDSKTEYLLDGCVINDSKSTLEHYIGKRCFTFDILAILPTQTAYVIISVFLHIIGSTAIMGSRVGRFVESYQPVLRLNRLVKWHALSKFFHRTESRTNSPNLLRAFRLGLQLALVIHWIACLYYMLSEYEGHGTTEWSYPTGPEFDLFYRKYIICMYWSTMTLTTIGERPSPTTDLEYVFTGFTFMVGVFVFAAVVGNVGDVISNMNAARRDFQSRMDQVKFYLNHRSVPDHLQTRIKRWAEYTWDRTKAIDEPSVLQILPDRLRTEVAIHVHLNILKKVSIFDDCEEGLLRELVLKLKPQIFSPGDYICRIGEIGREMFIINHGQVEILFPDSATNAMRCVAVMHPGNFFGEISLLKLDDGQNKRTADVRSIGFSELLCLSRRDLMLALTEYPEAKRILEEYAKERFRKTKKPIDETDESTDGSKRGSISPESPLTSAGQVFAKVMKREGFSRLLKRKDTDLLAIKTAVEELKAGKSAEIQESFVLMKRQIQELDRVLSERNIQLQEAYTQIGYLNSVVLRLNQSIPKSPDRVHASHNRLDIPDFQWPDLRHANTIDNADMEKDDNHQFENHPTSLRTSDRKYLDFKIEDHMDEAPMTGENLCQLRRSSFKYFGHQNAKRYDDPAADYATINTSFGSQEDEDSNDDMDSIERKFDEIGKHGYDYSYGFGNRHRRLSVPKKFLLRRSETLCGNFSNEEVYPPSHWKTSPINGRLSRSLTMINNFSSCEPEPLQGLNDINYSSKNDSSNPLTHSDDLSPKDNSSKCVS